MSNNLDIQLSDLHRELFDLSSRNPLINLKTEKLYFPENPDEKLLKKLHGKSSFYLKEYGLETSLYITHFLKWKAPDRENYFVSPLIYSKCKIVRRRKIETTLTIEHEEEYELNPSLEHYLTSKFDVRIPILSNTDDFFDDLNSEFSSNKVSINRVNNFNDAEEWQIISNDAIGIFNYKKSVLGKDYEAIKLMPSPSIKALLEQTEQVEPETLVNLPQLIDLDESQLEAVKLAQKNHLVIQGPPGTGKSHTIVGLIGNLLLQQKKILFISEKKSALDVVYDRLKKLGMESIVSYVDSSENAKKSFYKGLNKSWKQLNDPTGNNLSHLEDESSELLDYFENHYSKKREGLGKSVHDLVEELLQNPVNKKLEFNGEVPKYKLWNEHVEFLTFLEKRVVQEFKKDALCACSFAQLNKSAFLDNDPILTLEKRLLKVKKILAEIKSLQKKLGMKLDLKGFTQVCVSASVMAMVDNVQIDLLVNDTKLYASFNNWAKKYELVKAKLNQAITANKKWQTKPSLSEVIELIDLVKNKRQVRGILGSLRRQRLLSEKFAGFSPQLSDEAKIHLLESLRLEWRLQGELKEIEIKLDHNLGISNPEQDLPLIKELRRKLNQIAPNDYMLLLEQEDHLSVIRDLAQFHPKIQEIQTLIRFVFDVRNSPSINELQERTLTTLGDLPELTKWMEEVRSYFKLPAEIRYFISSSKASIEEFSAKVTEHALQRETRFETIFKDLNGKNLQSELGQKSRKNKNTQKGRTEYLIQTAKKGIREKEKLLVTPASKLSVDNKSLKKELKKGKKTLFHEMAKKQRFLPIHTFFSETESWLADIFSVWLMNPLSVSEQLPLTPELFDCIIFDEASQIPLEDSIPAIYRAKQIIVVGDEHQMPPSSFFTAKEQPKTLLQQAQFSFRNVMLKWHYRSEHPALIQFSNRLFYENELITFPPLKTDNPISFVKVQGVFQGGINHIEVDEIVARLRNDQSDPEKVGIIAFSLQQANLIQKRVLSDVPNGEKILVRNLENVQGVERDFIYVSIGYGYDAEKNFRMNFGPINQESGLNRLNVMVTRAKTKLTIISSITARDFKLSDNPGVQTLQDFLNYAEHGYQLTSLGMKTGIAVQSVIEIIEKNKLDVHFYNTTLQIGFNAFVQHNSGKVLLVDPTLDEAELDDLYTTYNVCNERYEKLKFILSTDFMQNNAKTEAAILSFFSS